MKTQIISKLLLSLSLVFVLGSAMTQVRGDTTAIEPRGPAVTIFIARIMLPGEKPVHSSWI